MKVKVAVAQYEVPNDTGEELNKLNEFAKSASINGAKILVTPETSIGMYAFVKEKNMNYLPDIQKISKDNKIYIATSFYRKINTRIFNQGYVVNDNGEVILDYKKIYLAPPEKDDDISAGKNISVHDSPFGKLGMLICKDGFNKYSHFLYEKLNELLIDIICIPTWSLGTWKFDTEEYIKTLYTYGAFISRSHILVSGNLNQETKSFGMSLIISPTSGVIKEGSRDREELLICDIDTNESEEARKFDKKWQPAESIKL